MSPPIPSTDLNASWQVIWRIPPIGDSMALPVCGMSLSENEHLIGQRSKTKTSFSKRPDFPSAMNLEL